MSAPIDEPRDVRPGEELDRERLVPFLAQTLGRPLQDNQVVIRQFPGGHSNLTYLIELRPDGHPADEPPLEWVLRRPPFGAKIKSAHDMGREHRVLSGLGRCWDRVPRVVALHDDDDVLGAPFYLTERVRGLILRRDPPAGLDFSPGLSRGLGEAFVDVLVALHGLEAGEAGLSDLGRPEGYVARQIEGWTKRYNAARTDDIPDIDEVARLLAERRPESPKPTLLHNDLKYDNLILDPNDPTRVRAVLDWEMSTRGDPFMDLGTALCYWVEANDAPALQAFRFGPTHVEGSLTRAELATRYLERSGRPRPDLVFYYAFGLFKTAVVVQQIYARYAAGHTRDERFAKMIVAARALGAQARAALRHESLSPPTA